MMKLFCLFICFGLSNIFAQESDLAFSIKYRHGFLIAHRSSMAHLPESQTNAFEGNVFFQTRGKKAWHRAFQYPSVGATILYTNAGNNLVLGRFVACYSFMQFKLLDRNKKNNLAFKIGAGLGYGNKVYDPILNPKNVAISSHFNAVINFGLYYQYEFLKNEINFGLDLTHFSNGSSKLPNLGINLPYFSLGYARKLSNEVILKQEKTKIDHTWKFSSIAIFSNKDTYPSGKEKFFVGAISLSAQKAFTFGFGYETGVDLIYKPSIQKYKPVIPKSEESMMQIGWYNAYFLSLDHLQIHVGLGFYLRDEYLADDFIYHRFGFKYAFENGLLLNLTLKSHWAKADYVEYGIGYRF